MFSVPTKPGEFYEYKTMSGVLPGRNIAALRLNSSVVKWYEKAGGIRKDKLPVAGGDKYVGLVMLFSTETGEPLAIFPDGYVQKLRVAGASAIAARYLARKDSKAMALLGAGWQASAHLVTMSMIRDLQEVRVFSPTPASRRKFVEEWSGKVSARVDRQRQRRRERSRSRYGDLHDQFDLGSVPGEILEPGMHVSCVKPCELDALTYRRAEPLIIHWREASLFRSPSASIRQVDPRYCGGLAPPDHARRRGDLGFAGYFAVGQWPASRASTRRERSAAFATTSAWVCSSPPSAAKCWRARGRREWDGRFLRIGFSRMCILKFCSRFKRSKFDVGR